MLVGLPGHAPRDTSPVGRLGAGIEAAAMTGPGIFSSLLDGLRVHDLRHTAISLWIADGVNPKKIAARAGHTSVRFVLDTYGHLYREDDSQELERADARIALARAADTRTGHVLPMPTRSVGNK
jgi:integrase